LAKQILARVVLRDPIDLPPGKDGKLTTTESIFMRKPPGMRQAYEIEYDGGIVTIRHPISGASVDTPLSNVKCWIREPSA
jgi:hypothetical protein